MLTNREIVIRYIGEHGRPDMTNKEIANWIWLHQKCRTCPVYSFCDEQEELLLCEQVIERWLDDNTIIDKEDDGK